MLGSLRVVNRTYSWLTVMIDGASRSRKVPPGASQTYYHVPSGHRNLAAQSSYKTFRHRIHIPAGGLQIWEVRPYSGTLKVYNKFYRDILVHLDGRPLKHVPSQSWRIFRRIDPGRHHVTGTFTGMATGNLPFSKHVHVVAGEVGSVFMRPMWGRLVVINSTGRVMKISIDGRRQTSIDPGMKRTIYKVRPGLRTVVAKRFNRYGDLVTFQQKTIMVRPAAAFSWYIRRGFGALRLFNPNPQWYKVTIDGRPRGKILGGKTRQFRRLKTGRRFVEVRDYLNRVRWSRHIRIRPGQNRVLQVGMTAPVVPTYGRPPGVKVRYHHNYNKGWN